MARINIDDNIHSDPRFITLIGIHGDYYKAFGLLISAWKMAQKYFKENKPSGLIPFDAWEDAPFASIIIAKLAEKREDGIYVKGSKDQFAWLIQKSEAGKSGGIKSGEARRSKPEADPSETKREQSKGEAKRSGSKPPTPTLSPSLSHSIDLSINNKNTGDVLDFKTAQQKSIPELMGELESKGIKINPDQVIDLFNSKLAGVGKLNHCRGLGSPALLNILDTFNVFQTLDDWGHLFEEVKKAKQITGEESGGVFLATLDWLSVRANALKADSGKYNLTLKNSTTGPPTSYELTDDEINQLKEAGEL